MRSIVICVILLQVLIGCQQNQPVLARGTSDQERQASVMLSKENEPIFLDQDLREQIRIVDYNVKRDDMGKLVVTAQLQTVVDRDVKVDIQCRFEHDDGKTEEGLWQPYLFRKHEPMSAIFTSLSAEVTKYRLYFRYPKYFDVK